MTRRRRRGRGHLSSIDLLPGDAAPIVAWGMAELRERNHTQIDICEEFNKRLRLLAEETGTEIEPISLAAFNRHSLRLASIGRRMDETRTITAALTERLGPGEADDLTVMVAEAIKTLVFELLEHGGEGGIDTKGAMEIARALHHAAQAQSVSSDRRRKVEKEYADKAAKAVDQVGKTNGLTADTVEAIKAKILGIEQ